MLAVAELWWEYHVSLLLIAERDWCGIIGILWGQLLGLVFLLQLVFVVVLGSCGLR